MKKNNIFTCIALLSLSLSFTVYAQTPITVQMEVNGQTETAPVKKGDIFNLKWASQGARACSVASSYGDFQLNGKEVVGSELPTSGDVQVQVVNWGATAVAFTVYCWDTPTGLSGMDSIQLLDNRVSTYTGKSPIISKLLPTQGVVGGTVIISGKNFKETNDISFVGSMRPVSGSSMNTISPVDGEVFYENISNKNDTLSFTVPSSFISIGEDGKTYTTAVVPGIYYVVVQTKNGKSGVSYFKVVKPGDNSKFKQIETTYLINQDLRIRDLGPEVVKLQRLLAKDKSIYPEGKATGYYGALTVKAVERFQCKYQNICSAVSNTYGKVDMDTRLKIDEVFNKDKKTKGI